MAQFKGAAITLLDTRPMGLVQGRKFGQTLKRSVEVLSVTDNANGDNIIALRVPTDSILARLAYGNTALTSGNAQLGLYYSVGDGTYTVLDADCFVTTLDVSSAVAFSDRLFAIAANIQYAASPAWAWISGQTTRPAYDWLYVAVTYSTGTGAAGTAAISVEYTE